MQMPEHNTTPEMISLKSIAVRINRLKGLTPHAEGLREWMDKIPENEYWNVIRAIRRLHEKFDFVVGAWGIGCTFELYATYCVNKEVGYVSPKKINRKREWKRKIING